MAFKVSNKAFEEVFGKKENNVIEMTTNPNDLLKIFKKNLKLYLEKNHQYPAANSLLHWIAKGGSLSTFTCRADIFDFVVTTLRKNKIPFLIVQQKTGKKGFIIRSKDEDKQHRLIRPILKAASSYCKVTSGKNAITDYQSRRLTDKNMIAIGDITKEQLVYLENLCDKVMPDEVLGVDKMEDGTYLLTIHGQTAILGNQKAGGRRFADALAETIFLYNSEAKKDLMKRSKNVTKYRRAKANGFLDKEDTTKKPVWVVGSGNVFVKRTLRGFEVGYAHEVGNDVLLDVDYRVSFDDEAYEKRLNSALLKITNHLVLYTLPDVIEHYKTKRSMLENAKISAEQHLMELIDFVVTNKVVHDSIYVRGNNWAAKMKHYQAETGKVIEGVRDGRIPPGYTKEQIGGIMDIVFKYKMNLDVVTPAISKLKNIEVHDRTKQLSKVRSVEEQLAKFSQVRNQEQTQNRQAPSRDDGRG